jgi:hypothetical protein
MSDLPQCSGCRPPSLYYCDYVCPIARKNEEDNDEPVSTD